MNRLTALPGVVLKEGALDRQAYVRLSTLAADRAAAFLAIMDEMASRLRAATGASVAALVIFGNFDGSRARTVGSAGEAAPKEAPAASRRNHLRSRRNWPSAGGAEPARLVDER